MMRWWCKVVEGEIEKTVVCGVDCLPPECQRCLNISAIRKSSKSPSAYTTWLSWKKSKWSSIIDHQAPVINVAGPEKTGFHRNECIQKNSLCPNSARTLSEWSGLTRSRGWKECYKVDFLKCSHETQTKINTKLPYDLALPRERLGAETW